MVKATDLRIGNFIKPSLAHHNHDTPFQVNGRLLFDMQDAPFIQEHHDPILLTPEILEACGFENTDHPWPKIKLGNRLVGDSGVYELSLGSTASPNGLPYWAGLKQGSGEGFTIKEAAAIQIADDTDDDEAFVTMKMPSNVCLRPINYIHELQNLYHSLTGQELEVNLKSPIV